MHFSFGKNPTWLCVGCLSARNSSVDVLVLRDNIERCIVPGKNKCRRLRQGVHRVQKADRHYLVLNSVAVSHQRLRVDQNINLHRKKFGCEMTELASFCSKCIRADTHKEEQCGSSAVSSNLCVVMYGHFCQCSVNRGSGRSKKEDPIKIYFYL